MLPLPSEIVAQPSFVFKAPSNKGTGTPLLKSKPAFCPKYQILASFWLNPILKTIISNKDNQYFLMFKIYNIYYHSTERSKLRLMFASLKGIGFSWVLI